ncbi:hypothetical protein ACIA5D_43780 [Actinoplanes sp. NPDC051513]
MKDRPASAWDQENELLLKQIKKFRVHAVLPLPPASGEAAS